MNENICALEVFLIQTIAMHSRSFQEVCIKEAAMVLFMTLAEDWESYRCIMDSGRESKASPFLKDY